MTGAAPTIRPRDRDTILQALSAGVVPRIGLQHIQVGRAQELKAALRDIALIADKGSAFRLITGEYGAGKTFLLHVIKAMALEKRLVTIQADLAPDRRLYASGGEARNLYQEAVRNLSTRAKPEGGALQSLIERFIADAAKSAKDSGQTPETVIDARLTSLRDYVGGYDYAIVLTAYWRGHNEGNEQLKSDALRWLRGEFTTKTEARKAVNVRTIVEDETVYDHLKLLAAFVQLAGYAGLLVILDEMVNLYKLQHAASRNQNYEQILRILNDVLQGNVSGFGVYMGGTPEFLMDTRRGLFSYPALQRRLAGNPFAAGGLADFAGPVIRLTNLTPEDLHILLEKVRRVFVSGIESQLDVPDEAILAFMGHCSKQLGEAYFRTPGSSVRGFVQLLSVLQQNPGVDWRKLVGGIPLTRDDGPAPQSESGGDDDLTSFKI
ncbi:MAG: ATP-binding protein [Rhodomicrobium sp.]